MIDTEKTKLVLIKKAFTRSLPMVGVGLLTAFSAGCGNGVTSSGPATGRPALSPPVVASSSPDPSSSSATSLSTAGSTSGSDKTATPTAPPATRSTASGAGPSSVKSRGGGSDDSGSGHGGSGHGGSGASTAGTSSSSTPSSGSPGRPTCTQSDLKYSVKAAGGGGAAGSNYLLLTFTNTTGNNCWLDGYPGVSFVGYGNGTQLGAAAKRSTGTAVRSVELNPGHSTTSLLQILNAGDFAATDCAPTTADGFRIYPPASTKAGYVPFKTQACQRSGAKQLTISPVGTSG